jgi:erythromycin esterase-like protein
MWRNTAVVDFIGWLRDHNASRAVADRAGFYGLDLYSLHRSIEAVLTYLGKVDPRAADRARYRYGCFDMFGEDPQAYGYASSLGLSRDCEDEVTAQLIELLSHYFRARLPEQFDAILHLDETSALEPLERWARDEVDLPETYPSGI